MADPLRRVGVFGWGIVAPRSPDVDAFARNLESPESWLSPFNGFGPTTSSSARPSFASPTTEPWLDARFPPSRFPQLAEKMDMPTQYAIGAFIQSLGQNPGIEAGAPAPRRRRRTSTSAPASATSPPSDGSTVAVDRAQRRWDRFWAEPERNAALRAWLACPRRAAAAEPDAPPTPAAVHDAERADAEDAWSPLLGRPLAGARASTSRSCARSRRSPSRATSPRRKLHVLKEKQRRRQRLQKEWGAPPPPWNEVSRQRRSGTSTTRRRRRSRCSAASPASTFAPVAACSTFGVALKLAMDAIRRGEAKAVVIGATDPPPHPLSVGAFYDGRVIAADGARVEAAHRPARHPRRRRRRRSGSSAISST